MTGDQNPTRIEDPLGYLPRVSIREYRNGETIYDFRNINNHLFLVIEGFVAVVRRTGKTETVTDLCQADEFFGEACLVQAIGGERATAIGKAKIMCWTVSAVREFILRQPGLGLALTQMLACRCISLEGRIMALSADSTARRLAKALLYMAKRFGRAEQNSPSEIRIPPFSHKLLAQYIGSTRAAVTHSLIKLRRESLIQYSRKQTVINYEGLSNWLHEYQSFPDACFPASGNAD